MIQIQCLFRFSAASALYVVTKYFTLVYTWATAYQTAKKLSRVVGVDHIVHKLSLIISDGQLFTSCGVKSRISLVELLCCLTRNIECYTVIALFYVQFHSVHDPVCELICDISSIKVKQI